MANVGKAWNIDDLRKMARKRVPKYFFDYLDGGAMEHGFALEATVLRVGTAPPTAGTIESTSIISLTIL